MVELPTFRILSAEDLVGISNPSAMIAAVEAAFAAMADRSVVVPPREHLEVEGTTLLVMPASGHGLFATKLVTVAAGNAVRGLPSIQGMMMIFDAPTGAPLALLDAAILTAQRTGAVAASAVKALADPELSSIGVVGCGVQGAWSVIHSAAVRPLSVVHCVTRSHESFARFRETTDRHAPHLHIELHRDPSTMLERVSCVVTATTSATPVLPDDPALLAGKIFVAIGGYRPQMRELPEAAFRLADAIIIDSPQAHSEAGDVVQPIAEGWISAEQILDFWRAGTHRRRPHNGATTIFKSVGHAAFDLFAARSILQRD